MSAPQSGPTAPASSRTRRWLVPLLVASIAFNLVVVGAALSGHFWPHHGERSGFNRSSDLMPRQFFHALDDERREELVAVFRARRPEFREEYRALRGASAALADALEREPFDPQAVQAAIAEHTRRSHRLVDLGATVVGNLAEALTAEERHALAEAIRQRIEQNRMRYSRRKD